MRKSNSNIFLNIIWLVFTLFISQALTKYGIFYHTLYVIICMVSYILCFYNWFKAGNKVSSLFVFFLAYCMFSNLGQSFLYVFNLPLGSLQVYYFASEEAVQDMLRFQCTCIAGLNLGLSLYLAKFNNKEKLQQFRLQFSNSCPQYGTYDTPLFVLLLICLAYYILTGLSMIAARQTMDYGDFFDSGRGIGQGTILIYIKYFTMFLSLWFILRKRHVVLIYIALGLFASMAMISGARGLAIQFLAILAFCAPLTHPSLFQKRYIALWVFGFLFAFSFLSIISATRQYALSSSLSFDGSSNLYMNILATISEMGFSETPAVLTMECVDTGFGFHQTIITTIIRALIPGSAYIPFIAQEDLGLSQWITDYANVTSFGLGYSFIGELYLNYSWFAWLFAMLFGYFCAYAETHIYRTEKNRLFTSIILLVLLLTFIPWSRDEFHRYQNVIRCSLYMIILYFCFIRDENRKDSCS